MKRLALTSALLWTICALFMQALVFTAHGLLPENTRNNSVTTFAAYLPEPDRSQSGNSSGLTAGSTAAKAAAAGFKTDSGTGLQIRAIENLRKSLGKSIAEQQVRIVDSYSGFSEQTLTRLSNGNQGSNSITLKVTGVGGSFMDFRQLQLLSGSFVSENDWNLRTITLDETSAWQLFGAIDIAGMTLMIQNQVFVVSGIVRLPQNWQTKLALADKPQAFVSYPALQALDANASITAYEVRLPEPVPGMGRTYFNDALSAGGLSADKLVLVEQEPRFTSTVLLSDWLDIGRRAMQDSAIVLPWWENAARAAADLASFLLVLSGLALGFVWTGLAGHARQSLSSGQTTLMNNRFRAIQREQKTISNRPMHWAALRDLLIIGLIGLVIALWLISRNGEWTPSGWPWFGRVAWVIATPSLMFSLLTGWIRLKIIIPDWNAGQRMIKAFFISILETVRTYLIIWIKWLRQNWPTKKETLL